MSKYVIRYSAPEVGRIRRYFGKHAEAVEFAKANGLPKSQIKKL